jgi:hypothetical protein
MATRTRKAPELYNGAAGGGVSSDVTQHALDMLNERLYRVETEVDSLKSDFADHRVAVAKLSEQVSSHEIRGAERHQQVIAAIGDLKTDYRSMLAQQAAERSQQFAFYSKVALGVLGIVSTIVAGVYGLTPTKAKTTASPPAAHAPAETQP